MENTKRSNQMHKQKFFFFSYLDGAHRVKFSNRIPWQNNLVSNSYTVGDVIVERKKI